MSTETKQAMDILVKHLSEDKTEGSYYHSWQSNIAMAFVDAYNRVEEFNSGPPGYLVSSNLHSVANDAAKNFLDMLIQQSENQ